VQLRDYQSSAIADVTAAHRRGNQGVLLTMPTGSGKTVVFSSIASGLAQANYCTLIVVPQVELVRQTSNKLRMFGCRHGVIAASDGPNPDPTALVQVAMVQTLRNRPRAMIREPNYLIYDEAHLAVADTFAAIRDRYPRARRLGVTATPWRLDGKPFHDLASEIVAGPSVRDMVARGALVPFRTLSIPLTEFAAKGRQSTEFARSAMAEAYKTNALVGDVIEHYHQLAANRTGIVFAASIDHSRMLTERFIRSGIVAEHLDGTTPMGDRGDGARGLPTRIGITERLELGITQVICNYGVLTTGFDCPRVSAIVVARATASKSLWIQMAGRGLRPCPEIGKTDCLILDHGGNARRHGNLDYQHVYTLDGRDKTPRNAPEPDATRGKECPQCYLFQPVTEPACAQCGHQWQMVLTGKPEPRTVDGQLVDVGSGAAPVAVRPGEGGKMHNQQSKAAAVERARGWASGWGG